MNYKDYPELAAMAAGRKKADLVLKNACVLNVFTEEFEKNDVAISAGIIVGVGSYSGVDEVDMTGRYIVPGFIDSHLHLESTLVRPSQLIREALKYGTTAFIVDPHESANVCGKKGIDFILDETENLPGNIYVMMPSCVPATDYEDNGAAIASKDMEEYLENRRILGLGEVMDSRSVIEGRKGMIDKLVLFENRVKDGHAPGLSDKELAAYALAGIKTDHECIDYTYAKKQITNGMYVLIREGSAARNLEAIVSGIVKDHASTERYCFCTDDKHISSIEKEGHISYNIRKAISLGLRPEKAYKMASYNPAQCYQLKELGAVAPGCQADLVVLKDAESVDVSEVFYKGRPISSLNTARPIEISGSIMNTMHVKDFSGNKLVLKIESGMCPVIQVVPGEIVTRRLMESVPVKEGIFQPDCTYNKIAVIERHKKTGRVGVGIVKGFGIKGGAIASSVSHDSHNIVVIGDNDKAMELAVQEVIKIGGGYVIASAVKVIQALPLPIMGLMSTNSHEDTEKKVNEMIACARAMGVDPGIDPFINLSFMALTVIPQIRITDRGVYDVDEGRFL
jgi:adenine deaminase